ncbi:MAG: hypothetical protein E6J75_18390 [Deltaproteobacteria bacterium]|nr:MAG: hypothetical protein E6J75_18390 [Deltaproteobacteria bacterium]
MAATLRATGLPVSVSSEVLPVFREYERASTTALDAYVAPALSRYLRSLDGALRDAGLGCEVEVMRSGGGTFGATTAASNPVHTLLSGPAAGAWGAAAVGSGCGVTDLIAFDMGGTSTDATLIEGGRPRTMAEGQVAGLPFAVCGRCPSRGTTVGGGRSRAGVLWEGWHRPHRDRRVSPARAPASRRPARRFAPAGAGAGDRCARASRGVPGPGDAGGRGRRRTRRGGPHREGASRRVGRTRSRPAPPRAPRVRRRRPAAPGGARSGARVPSGDRPEVSGRAVGARSARRAALGERRANGAPRTERRGGLRAGGRVGGPGGRRASVDGRCGGGSLGGLPVPRAVVRARGHGAGRRRHDLWTCSRVPRRASRAIRLCAPGGRDRGREPACPGRSAAACVRPAIRPARTRLRRSAPRRTDGADRGAGHGVRRLRTGRARRRRPPPRSDNRRRRRRDVLAPSRPARRGGRGGEPPHPRRVMTMDPIALEVCRASGRDGWQGEHGPRRFGPDT